ncbi:hypothetical protein J5N97_007314 [Dioscorea zingiberensis]|uniref:Uncharacterized protein n=1 Tax=Dioscorea zingiberensis TaxID=325984 RepID=A0A9D5DDB5_9LILI|nr:hypothetical protein J5N97_007314 [Dioscorea zingiberensis]
MARSAPLSSQQMEDMSRWRIPAFGNWEFYEELPITQYFQSAAHPQHFYPKVDVHAKPSQQHHHNHHTKVKKSGQKGGRGGGGGGVHHQNQNQNQKQKQSKVCDVIPQTPPKRAKTPKAVDEDLYKIPPELLHQKPKRKRVLGSLFLGCIGINCVSSS